MKRSIVLYKCKCMTDEVELRVLARRPHQIITDWLDDAVKPAVGKDHRARSPLCQSLVMEHLKIPAPEDGRQIGSSPQDAN